MIDNNIRKLRSQKGLTQRQLADALGMTLPQIHRIELGLQTIHLMVASCICEFLQEDMRKVFPHARKLLTAMKKQPPEALLDHPFLDLEIEAGIDLDVRIWTLKIGLKGRKEPMYFIVSSHEKERLIAALANIPENTVPFFSFNTATSVIILNLAHVLYCHFLWDTPFIYQEKDYSDEVQVICDTVSDPFCFAVEPESAQSTLELANEIASLIFRADTGVGKNEFITFMDEDGETVFLQAAQVILIDIPLCVLYAELLEDESFFEE